jgi:hypothetical protein
MFYCSACARRNLWPESFMKAHGACEVCHRTAECNDFPASLLPVSPARQPVPDDEEVVTERLF